MSSQRLRGIALALALGFISSTLATSPAQAETFARCIGNDTDESRITVKDQSMVQTVAAPA